MATVTLYIALSNITHKRTPEFVAENEKTAERLAMKLLNCQADDVVLLSDEVDEWMDPDRVLRAAFTEKFFAPR